MIANSRDVMNHDGNWGVERAYISSLCRFRSQKQIWALCEAAVVYAERAINANALEDVYRHARRAFRLANAARDWSYTFVRSVIPNCGIK